MNRVILIGRLTREPELKTLTSGSSYASFGLAVDRRRQQDGQQGVDFFNVTAWGKLGDNVAQYLHKGRSVAVDGRIQMREWTAQDGSKRTACEIVAGNVEFLDKAQGAGAATAAPHVPETREEMEAQGWQDASEDDLPF